MSSIGGSVHHGVEECLRVQWGSGKTVAATAAAKAIRTAVSVQIEEGQCVFVWLVVL